MRALAALLLVWAGAASAQTLDCTAPQTQVEMTGCADLAYKAADRDLNAAWDVARAAAQRMDAGAAQYGGPQDNFDILLGAQRKWIAFRDAACDAEALLARGGTMQNMIFLDCAARLTRARTFDLWRFGGNG